MGRSVNASIFSMSSMEIAVAWNFRSTSVTEYPVTVNPTQAPTQPLPQFLNSSPLSISTLEGWVPLPDPQAPKSQPGRKPSLAAAEW